MTTVSSPRTEDRISVRADDDRADAPAIDDPNPGPGAIFVLLGAIAVGLAAAFAFQAAAPDTPIVILGGTLLIAAILGFVGLFRYEWFLLIVLAVRPALDDLIADQFGTFQPSAILGILAIGVTALHLISRKFTGNWRQVTPLGYAYMAFFLGFLPSFATSVDRGVSQAALFGLASVVLMYLAIEQHMLEDGRFFFRVLIASAIGMVVPIVTGFVQFFFTGTLDPGGSGLVRIDGSFAHPNTFATYLVFVVLIAIGVMPTVQVKHKLIVLAIASLGGFLLVATFARGAWASFLLGTLLMAARINKKLVFLIMGGATLIGIGVPGVRSRVDNLFATTGPNGGAKTDDSIGWRIGYWDELWGRFAFSRPITGIGIDATKTQTFAAKDPHNSFLQAWLEGGIIGFTGFMLVVGLATYACVKTWKKARRGELAHQTKLISVGAIAALLSVAAQLITENVLLNTIVWWYMNIAMAYLAVLTWGRRKEAEPQPDFDQLQLPAGDLTSPGPTP